MRTLILLDCSLSMLAPFRDADSLSRNTLALEGITQFVSNVLSFNKQHLISLGTFSSKATLLQDMTGDLSVLERCVSELQGYCESSTSLQSALNVIDDQGGGPSWAHDCPATVVIVTDGLGDEVNIDVSVLSNRLNLSLHVVFINSQEDISPSVHRVLQSLPKAKLHYLHKGNALAARELFNCVSDEYSPFVCIVRCGTMNSEVQVIPSPSTITIHHGYSPPEQYLLSSFIDIIGFMKPAELAAAPISSKHLLMATNDVGDSEKEHEPTPNFCVLLHGSLKVSSMLAVCRIANDWYGAIYHIVDSKRSNLVLLCFEPGASSIRWIGGFSGLSYREYAETSAASAFPVLQRPKPSYAINKPCWIEPYAMQADVQKVVRYVKKLPDRHNHFYAEMNKLVRQCLAEGFPELLTNVAQLLVREANSNSANAETKKHALYVANFIKAGSLNYTEGIKPPPK